MSHVSKAAKLLTDFNSLRAGIEKHMPSNIRENGMGVQALDHIGEVMSALVEVAVFADISEMIGCQDSTELERRARAYHDSQKTPDEQESAVVESVEDYLKRFNEKSEKESGA